MWLAKVIASSDQTLVCTRTFNESTSNEARLQSNWQEAAHGMPVKIVCRATCICLGLVLCIPNNIDIKPSDPMLSTITSIKGEPLTVSDKW